MCFDYKSRSRDHPHTFPLCLLLVSSWALFRRSAFPRLRRQSFPQPSDEFPTVPGQYRTHPVTSCHFPFLALCSSAVAVQPLHLISPFDSDSFDTQTQYTRCSYSSTHSRLTRYTRWISLHQCPRIGARRHFCRVTFLSTSTTTGLETTGRRFDHKQPGPRSIYARTIHE